MKVIAEESRMPNAGISNGRVVAIELYSVRVVELKDDGPYRVDRNGKEVATRKTSEGAWRLMEREVKRLEAIVAEAHSKVKDEADDAYENCEGGHKKSVRAYWRVMDAAASKALKNA